MSWRRSRLSVSDVGARLFPQPWPPARSSTPRGITGPARQLVTVLVAFRALFSDPVEPLLNQPESSFIPGLGQKTLHFLGYPDLQTAVPMFLEDTASCPLLLVLGCWLQSHPRRRCRPKSLSKLCVQHDETPPRDENGMTSDNRTKEHVPAATAALSLSANAHGATQRTVFFVAPVHIGSGIDGPCPEPGRLTTLPPPSSNISFLGAYAHTPTPRRCP